jgi:hypothetical protein
MKIMGGLRGDERTAGNKWGGGGRREKKKKEKKKTRA